MLAPFLLILSGWLRFNSVKGSAQSRKITIPWFAVFFIGYFCLKVGPLNAARITQKALIGT